MKENLDHSMLLNKTKLGILKHIKFKSRETTYQADADLRASEKQYLQKRFELMEKVSATNAGYDVLEMSLEQILHELGYDPSNKSIITGKQIKYRPLLGSDFQDASMGKINLDQGQLVKLMKNVSERNDQITDELIHQLNQDDNLIWQYSLKDLAIERDNQTMQEQIATRLGERFIQQLKRALKSKSELPDQVLNILQDYHYDREKQRETKLSKENGQGQEAAKRLSYKQTLLISREFQLKTGENRQIETLEQMLRINKYLNNFD